MSETYRRLAVIELPGQPLTKFDIGWVEPGLRRYYLADRSNARVSVIDTVTETYLGAIGEGDFTGAPASNKLAGPNGVAVLPDNHQVWAGDGDSTVKVYDAGSGKQLASVHTGGEKRVDELAYAPDLDLVLVANDAEPVPFATLISTVDFRILGRIDFPRATNGLHQPVWDAERGVFYLPVTEVDGDPARGEIAIIDPRLMAVSGVIPVSECQPAGLAIGPGGRLCVGCSKNAIAAGFLARSLVLDLGTGAVASSVFEVGGSDEVWYDPGEDRYLLAASRMPGGPVLGVIDAATNRWLASVPTSADSHSVAADQVTGHAFVPLTPTADVPRGGVGVFGRTGPG